MQPMQPVSVLARVAHVLLSVVGWLSMHAIMSFSLISYSTHNSQVDNHGGRVGYVLEIRCLLKHIVRGAKC
jgi:hypothetical protein